LADLVRAGGETMGTLRHTLLASLGLARQVDEEIEARLQALVQHRVPTHDDLQEILRQLDALEAKLDELGK
jgi:hypothetical protein